VRDENRKDRFSSGVWRMRVALLRGRDAGRVPG